MVDIVKFLKEMDEKSRANIAATQRRQQPLKDTGHGFKARGYVEPGQLKTHEQMYPGHRAAAQKAGVGGIAKFFTPEHKKWIAGNRAQMDWLPKDQPKYYGEDWRRLQDLRKGYVRGLDDRTPRTFAEAETPGLAAKIVAGADRRDNEAAGRAAIEEHRGNLLKSFQDMIPKVDITQTIVEGEPVKTVKKWAESAGDIAQDVWGIGKSSAEGWMNVMDQARAARKARNTRQVGGDASLAESMYTADRARQRMPFNVARGLGGRTSQLPHSVGQAPPLWRMRGINRTSPSASPARQLPGVRDTGPGIYSPMQRGGDARLAESMYGRRQQMPSNLYNRDEFGRIPTSRGYQYSIPAQTRQNILNATGVPMPGPMVGGQAGTAEENLYRPRPLPYPTPIFPRAEAMRGAYESNPILGVQKRRDFDVDQIMREGAWNQRNETYEQYLQRSRNPWPNFYGMRESQYYPHYGRSNY
jgi:hypothetical protein